VNAASQILPSSLEDEATVLCALLTEPERLDEVASVLAAEHFYADANSWIFKAIQDVDLKGGPIDIVSVTRNLSESGRLEQIGGMPYLAQLAHSTPYVANAMAHAEVIREKWRLRQLITRCRRLATEGHAVQDVQGFIEDAEREIAQLAQSASTNDAKVLREIIAKALRLIDETEKRGGAITGLATGFTRLDRQCSGLHNGDLYIIAARPGMGKTSFVMNMSVAACEADPDAAVLFLSLEMPKEQLAARLLSAEAHVELAAVRNGKLDREEWSRLNSAAGKLAELSVWIDDSAALSLIQVKAKVRRLKAELQATGKKLRLVVIDYLQLMRGSRQAGSREQEISEISRGLKAMAKEESIPVVALSQLNRSVETRTTKDKRPQLSDLRESGAIEQDADCVIFIYRDEYYNKDTEAKGIAELIVAKQRNGPTGTVLCKFTGEFTRFDNLEAEQFGVDQFDDFMGDEPRFS
jgi:replicative DNA helicase